MVFKRFATVRTETLMVKSFLMAEYNGGGRNHRKKLFLGFLALEIEVTLRLDRNDSVDCSSFEVKVHGFVVEL